LTTFIDHRHQDFLVSNLSLPFRLPGLAQIDLSLIPSLPAGEPDGCAWPISNRDLKSTSHAINNESLSPKRCSATPARKRLPCRHLTGGFPFSRRKDQNQFFGQESRIVIAQIPSSGGDEGFVIINL